jgi:hypothetical protein
MVKALEKNSVSLPLKPGAYTSPSQAPYKSFSCAVTGGCKLTLGFRSNMGFVVAASAEYICTNTATSDTQLLCVNGTRMAGRGSSSTRPGVLGIPSNTWFVLKYICWMSEFASGQVHLLGPSVTGEAPKRLYCRRSAGRFRWCRSMNILYQPTSHLTASTTLQLQPTSHSTSATMRSCVC